MLVSQEGICCVV